MHAESGFFRPKPDGSIEVVIAQSSGLVEVQVKDLITLTIHDFFFLIIIDFFFRKELTMSISKRSHSRVSLSETHPRLYKTLYSLPPQEQIHVFKIEFGLCVFDLQVKETSRGFELVDGKLSYVVHMSTTTQHLQPHLKATLEKL